MASNKWIILNESNAKNKYLLNRYLPDTEMKVVDTRVKTSTYNGYHRLGSASLFVMIQSLL